MLVENEREQIVESRENKGKRNLFIFLVLAAILVIAGIVGSFVWSGMASNRSNDSRPSVAYTPPNPPQALTSSYEGIVQDQVAQGLHLTVTQLKTKVRANADGLFGVAQQQGVDDNQLATVLTNAFQTASDQIVSAGTWTRQQATAEMQYWNARSSKALAGDVTTWLAA